MFAADEIRQCQECGGELHGGEVYGRHAVAHYCDCDDDYCCCVWEEAETTWIAPDRLAALREAVGQP